MLQNGITSEILLFVFVRRKPVTKGQFSSKKDQNKYHKSNPYNSYNVIQIKPYNIFV